MDAILSSLLLAFAVSADALACGFAAGAGRIKIPFRAAVAAATVSTVILCFGYAAGRAISPLVSPHAFTLVSFFVLSGMALCKLAPKKTESGDCNADRYLSVREGAALGAALSADGLTVGFGGYAGVVAAVCSCALSFVLSAAALYGGAKSGMCVQNDRAGNIAAGVTLAVLAALKLLP